MELNINLLPQTQRERFKKKKYNTYLISWAIILVIVAIGILVLVFFTKAGLNAQKNHLESQISETQEELEKKSDVKNKVEAFNQIIGVAANLDKSKIHWSSVMNDIALATPIDVQLTKTKMWATGEFSISGKAATLRSVMKFKEKIAMLSYLSQIELSKSTLEPGKGYIFEMKGKVNLINGRASQ